MKLPLALLLACTACGGAPATFEVVYVTPDAGHLAALAPDAAVVEADPPTATVDASTDPPAADAGVTSVDASMPEQPADAGATIDADALDAGDDAADGSDACVPLTAAQCGETCGFIPDGCGGVVGCPGCLDGLQCLHCGETSEGRCVAQCPN